MMTVSALLTAFQSSRGNIDPFLVVSKIVSDLFTKVLRRPEKDRFFIFFKKPGVFFGIFRHQEAATGGDLYAPVRM